MPVTPTTDSGWASYQDSMRLFLPAGTNYWVNPRLIDTNEDGLANDLIYNQSVVGTPDKTCNAGVQTLSYTGEPGDSGGLAQFYTYPATPDLGGYSQTITVTFRARGTGGVLYAFTAYNSGWGVLGQVEILRDGVERDYALTFVTQADWPHFAFALGMYSITESIENYLEFPRLCISKDPVAVPYFDGSTQGCSWDGTEDASTSTRAASHLVLTDYVEITSAGVAPAGAKYAYYREDTGPYFGPVIITDIERDGAWEAAVAAEWDDCYTLWNNYLEDGDLLLPLWRDGLGYIKGIDVYPYGRPVVRDYLKVFEPDLTFVGLLQAQVKWTEKMNGACELSSVTIPQEYLLADGTTEDRTAFVDDGWYVDWNGRRYVVADSDADLESGITFRGIDAAADDLSNFQTNYSPGPGTWLNKLPSQITDDLLAGRIGRVVRNAGFGILDANDKPTNWSHPSGWTSQLTT